MASLLIKPGITIRSSLLGPNHGARVLSAGATKPRSISFRQTPKVPCRSHRRPLKPTLSLRVSASSSAAPAPSPNEITRTVSSVVAAAASLASVILQWVRNAFASIAPSPEQLASLQTNFERVIGPLFFAARNGDMDVNVYGSSARPLTVVAAGIAKWLDIYSGVLMLRVLLSWFPNMPWDKQPLSAIRDLCDPYLNLFRNVIPPIFNSLDVSPLLAFAILGVLSSLLNTGA